VPGNVQIVSPFFLPRSCEGCRLLQNLHKTRTRKECAAFEVWFSRESCKQKVQSPLSAAKSSSKGWCVDCQVTTYTNRSAAKSSSKGWCVKFQVATYTNEETDFSLTTQSYTNGFHRTKVGRLVPTLIVNNPASVTCSCYAFTNYSP